MGAIKAPVLHYLLALSLTRIPYPEVRRDDSVTDDYHGTKIADPYRWLEDEYSKETEKFVENQQKLTAEFLSKVPSRPEIRKRLEDLWNYPRYGAPEKVNGKYYTFENSGLQNQSVMYVQDSLDSKPQVFLDPNKFSEDGTVAMDDYQFTTDGKFMVYSTSQSGSDWKLVRIRDNTRGMDLEDVLHDSKWPSPEWSPDGKGIFYTRFPKINGSAVTEDSKVYYHVLGTSQDDDILIAEFPERPKRNLYVKVTDDHRYLIVGGTEVFSANSIHIVSLKEGINDKLQSQIVPVFPSATDATYNYITNMGSTFLFLTNKDAPNYRLITVNIEPEKVRKERQLLEDQDFRLMSTFIPEHPTNVISSVMRVAGDKLVIKYIEDVKNTLELRSLRSGKLLHRFDLAPGTISSLSAEDEHDNEIFFTLQNHLSPGMIHRCEVGQNVSCEVVKQINLANTDLSKFLVEQVFYKSKDGTKIPMYIVRKKDFKFDGSAPTLLYGYGGFNSNLMPRFSVSNLVFVDGFDGVYAVANIRGGGEYGEKWHLDGMLLNKQNVFDDFQAAAEYLIQEKYTTSSKLTIQGGSNGGLLVAACVNQRPELYGAAIAQVGVMDMLRYQKFTIGYAWCPEYGCSEEKIHFENLIKYSPIHNIRVPEAEGVQYPAVLVTTADHDDRVVPAHSYKYAAQLQQIVGKSSKQTNPLLLRVDIKAGHGAGKPTAKRIDEVADIYAFIAETLGLNFNTSKSDQK